VRTYPRPLGDEAAARPLLMSDEPATPGARVVCERLFTLPTHPWIGESDREQLARWAREIRSG
jgi:hypothetical protein